MKTMKKQASELVDQVPTPLQSETFSWQFPFRKYLALIGFIILIGGLIGGVVLALQSQENRSHASGTITLQVDPNPQVDLAKKTVTFLVRLIPSGDPLPQVAAVKLHMLVGRRTLPLGIAQQIGGGDVVQFVSFALHDPKAFPLEGDNPSGIPPFSANPSITPSIIPFKTPTPSTTIVPGCRVVTMPCDPVKLPDGTLSKCPTPQVVCQTPTPVTKTPTPCPFFQPRGGEGAYPPPCRFPTPTITIRPVLGVQDSSHGAPTGHEDGGSALPSVTPTDQGEQDQGALRPIDAGQESGHLYYSVGDLYAKTVSQPVTLADITYAITMPIDTWEPAQQANNVLLQKFQDKTLTISFAPDTQVYGINPTGDIKNPFVTISFTPEPLTFDLTRLITTPTPSSTTPNPSITNIPTPTPCLVKVDGVMKPCQDVTPTPHKNGVSLQMLLACIDLKYPMSNPASNYNSQACKAYPNRADADLNGDGYINGIDLNYFYRGPQ